MSLFVTLPHSGGRYRNPAAPGHVTQFLPFLLVVQKKEEVMLALPVCCRLRGSTILAVAASVLCSLFSSSRAQADTLFERRQAADELVQEALHREIDGRDEERAALLDAAREQVPAYEAALWHQGHVQFYNRWVPANDVPNLAADNVRLIAYYLRRDETPDTLEGHLRLATWCDGRGLDDQARAHLFKVIQFDADHAGARAALGFVRVDNLWMSQLELEQARADADVAATELARWTPRLKNLLYSLNHRSVARRESAEERIRAIDDVTAIPALEAVLAVDSERAACLVIDVLDQMAHPDASLALARQAIFSPHESIRTAAAESLKNRPWDSFIPAMLSELYTPVQSITSVGLSGGRLVYRHSFFREGQTAHENLVLESSYRRIARSNGDASETFGRALLDAERTNRVREAQAAAQNEFTEQLNERICATLTIITGEKLGVDPTGWWAWWNEYNEVFLAGDKVVNTSIERETVNVTDRSRPSTGGGTSPGDDDGGESSGPGASSSGGGSTSEERSSSERWIVTRGGPGLGTYDCLVAGTLIWTARGALPVEQIQVGDLTLSQNPVTGELAYKPVVQTTLRPAGELVQVHAGNQMFECSGGHPFWVSGEGWVKARDLQSGSLLHTADGTLQISSVETGSTQETFNLVVDGFHTYFIGSDKVLSHDNTVRDPVTTVVPGLPLE